MPAWAGRCSASGATKRRWQHWRRRRRWSPTPHAPCRCCGSWAGRRWSLGRLEAAAGHFESALRLDPRDPEALDHLALVRFRQQRYAAALELHERLLEVTPDDAQVHANRGAALYYLGRIDAAVRGFERALSLEPALETARSALKEIRKAHPRPGS